MKIARVLFDERSDRDFVDEDFAAMSGYKVRILDKNKLGIKLFQ